MKFNTRELPYPILPYPALPYLPYTTPNYCTLPHPTLPYPPYPLLPCTTTPHSTLPYATLSYPSCPTLPHPPCPSPPHQTLPYPILPCPVLSGCLKSVSSRLKNNSWKQNHPTLPLVGLLCLPSLPKKKLQFERQPDLQLFCTFGQRTGIPFSPILGESCITNNVGSHTHQSHPTQGRTFYQSMKHNDPLSCHVYRWKMNFHIFSTNLW